MAQILQVSDEWKQSPHHGVQLLLVSFNGTDALNLMFHVDYIIIFPPLFFQQYNCTFLRFCLNSYILSIPSSASFSYQYDKFRNKLFNLSPHPNDSHTIP